MTDKHYEHLSALLDGEDIDGSVLDSMLNDDAQKAQFQRYQLASSIIKNDVTPGMAIDISAAVAGQVRQEPNHSVTAHASLAMAEAKENGKQGLPGTAKAANDSWWRTGASVAIAASVALVTVIGVQNYQFSPSQTSPHELPAAAPVFETAPFSGVGSPVSFNAGQGVPMLQEDSTGTNQRRYIQSFFVDHQQQSLLSQQELQKQQAEDTDAQPEQD